MPPSWHWTGHSGSYWQQAELCIEMVQLNNDDDNEYIDMYSVVVCNVVIVCGQVEGESEGHVTSEGWVTIVGNERCHSTNGDTDICRSWWYRLHRCRLSCTDNVSWRFFLLVMMPMMIMIIIKTNDVWRFDRRSVNQSHSYQRATGRLWNEIKKMR